MMDYAKDLLNALTKATARPNRRKLRRDERKVQRQVDASFADQSKLVIRESKKLLSKKDVKSLEDDVDAIFDKINDSKLIKGILTTTSGSMLFGGKYRVRKNKLSEFGISFDLKHPLAVQYLQTDRPLVLAKMTDSTRELLKPLIIDAVEKGLAPQALAKEISEHFAFSKNRSLMIAVNEVGTAYETGNFAPIQDAVDQGIGMEKSWSTVGDGKVTPSHTENANDGWIDIDKTFTGTGDLIAPASDNPRCRCTTLYQVKS